jgi:hypothetical protein
MLAERMDMYPIKNDFVSIRDTDTLWTNTMAIFQYMIGNADYSVVGRQNVKLLKSKDYMKPSIVPVPYDFDYSGLVNAHYAVPGETLGISSVKERYFLGPCRSIEDYQEVIDNFMSNEEVILDLVAGYEYLSEKDRTVVSNYLNEFYNGLNQNQYLEKAILSTCQ